MGQSCCCEECCCEESYRYRPIYPARFPSHPTYQNLLHDDEYDYCASIYGSYCPCHVEVNDYGRQDDNRECPYRNVCYRYMESLEIPKFFFNGASEYNKCYCSRCQNKREEQSSYSSAENCRLPIGWSRFALEVKSEDVQSFDDCKVAFHGTASKDIEKILNSEEVALPYHQIKASGSAGSCSASVPEHFYAISRQPAGHDGIQICISPSLKYAEKCASPALFYDTDTSTHYSCTVAFQVSIKPSCEEQTMNNDEITMDSELNDSELEWSTKQVDTVLICGLLVKVTKFNF